jgi:transcriptional regulator with XRE-family HTH domain
LKQTARWSAYLSNPPDGSQPIGDQLRLWLDAKGWEVRQLARKIDVSARSVFNWLRGKHPPTGTHREKLYNLTGLRCLRHDNQVTNEREKQRSQSYCADLTAYRENPNLETELGEDSQVCRECGVRTERPQPHIVAEHAESLIRWLDDHRASELSDSRNTEKNLALLGYRLRWGFGRRAPLASGKIRSSAARRAKQLQLAGKLQKYQPRPSTPQDIDVLRALSSGFSMCECAKQLNMPLATLWKKARQLNWDTSAHLKSRSLAVSYVAELRRHLIATPQDRNAEQIIAWHKSKTRDAAQKFSGFLPGLLERLRQPGALEGLMGDHKNIMRIANSMLNHANSLRSAGTHSESFAIASAKRSGDRGRPQDETTPGRIRFAAAWRRLGGKTYGLARRLYPTSDGDRAESATRLFLKRNAKAIEGQWVAMDEVEASAIVQTGP